MLALHFFIATFLDYTVSYPSQARELPKDDTTNHGKGHAYGHDKKIREWSQE